MTISPEEEELRLIQSAIRLSANVLARDARQLAGQLIGRLLGNTSPSIQAFLKQAAERKVWPWLRPLKPSLTAPGGPLIRTLEGHTSLVTAVAVTPDGRHVVSGSDDNTLRVWDLATGETKTTLQGHTNSVNAVAVTPDGRHVVSGSEDETLRVWDLATGETKTTLQGHTDWVCAVAVTPDGRHVVSGSGRQHAARLGPGDGGNQNDAPGPYRARSVPWQSHPMVATWSPAPGTTRCAFGTWRRGKPKRRSRAIPAGSMAVAVTPDGRHVVSGSDDNTLRVWDLATGETKTTLQGHTSSVNAVAVTPDGRHVVSGSADHTLRVWDLATGETKTTLQGHTSSVNAVAVTPDGRHVVSGSGDNTLRVWDLATGKTKTTLQGHTSWVNAVAVTPDGRHVVSGSDDHTLRVWDLKDGKEILTFTVDGEVTACIVAQDNWTIVAGDGFGRLHFLRIVEADETKSPMGDTKIQLLHPGGATNQENPRSPSYYAACTKPVPCSSAMPTPTTRAQIRKERWLDRFIEFLKPLVRQEDFTLCSDQDIEIGEDWHQHIQAHLNGAKAVVLLISPAFLASDYIANSELPVILKNATDQGVRIFPILISPSVYKRAKYKYPDPKTGPQQFTLASIQAANPPSETLIEMTEGGQNRVLDFLTNPLSPTLSPLWGGRGSRGRCQEAPFILRHWSHWNHFFFSQVRRCFSGRVVSTFA